MKEAINSLIAVILICLTTELSVGPTEGIYYAQQKEEEEVEEETTDDTWDLGRFLADHIQSPVLYMATHCFFCHGEPEEGA